MMNGIFATLPTERISIAGRFQWKRRRTSLLPHQFKLSRCHLTYWLSFDSAGGVIHAKSTSPSGACRKMLFPRRRMQCFFALRRSTLGRWLDSLSELEPAACNWDEHWGWQVDLLPGGEWLIFMEIVNCIRANSIPITSLANKPGFQGKKLSGIGYWYFITFNTTVLLF